MCGPLDRKGVTKQPIWMLRKPRDLRAGAVSRPAGIRLERAAYESNKNFPGRSTLWSQERCGKNSQSTAPIPIPECEGGLDAKFFPYSSAFGTSST
jgi:hypothetical protein